MDYRNETLTSLEALDELIKFDEKIASKQQHFIGYPINGNIKLNEFFTWWSQASASHAPLNDVGDPSQDLPHMINARPFERNVLKIFSELLHFEPDAAWGYITSSGTLGNEQGLLTGREILGLKGEPILYFSQDSHYSIMSIARILRIDFKVVKSQTHGEMDYDDLESIIDVNRPALINLNIGTTFKGAIDQIDKVQAVLSKHSIENYYIHADAALFGGFLPFLNASFYSHIDFSRNAYDSIAISGHKFFGSPIPMGVFLMRKKHLDKLKNDFVDYIYAKNVTIPCSRSSLNSLLFWWILNTKSHVAWQQDAHHCLDTADYLHQKLLDLGIDAWRHPYSNIVYFVNHDEELNLKWSLAQCHCQKLGLLSHVVVMQHVTKDLLDEFLTPLYKIKLSA